jgi:hypothetical protein
MAGMDAKSGDSCDERNLRKNDHAIRFIESGPGSGELLMNLVATVSNWYCRCDPPLWPRRTFGFGYGKVAAKADLDDWYKPASPSRRRANSRSFVATSFVTLQRGRDVLKSPQGCSGTRLVGKDESSRPVGSALSVRKSRFVSRMTAKQLRNAPEASRRASIKLVAQNDC